MFIIFIFSQLHLNQNQRSYRFKQKVCGVSYNRKWFQSLIYQ